MLNQKQPITLQNKYLKLIEKSYSYKFLDESISDLAAFKAMKLLKKISQLSYLNRKLIV